MKTCDITKALREEVGNKKTRFLSIKIGPICLHEVEFVEEGFDLRRVCVQSRMNYHCYVFTLVIMTSVLDPEKTGAKLTSIAVLHAKTLLILPQL